jgi:hypothetical protein
MARDGYWEVRLFAGRERALFKEQQEWPQYAR